MNRGELDVGTLLTVVLALVAVWIVVEIVSEIVGFVLGVFAFFRPILGLLLVAAVVLWLVDRI